MDMVGAVPSDGRSLCAVTEFVGLTRRSRCKQSVGVARVLHLTLCDITGFFRSHLTFIIAVFTRYSFSTEQCHSNGGMD